MIGVICKKEEKETAREFFELFKTPWEFYRNKGRYDVVICTKEFPGNISAKAVFIYGDKETNFDKRHSIRIRSGSPKDIATFRSCSFPLYCDQTVIKGEYRAIIRMAETGEPVGIEVECGTERFYRISYNLFREIHYILSSGQPSNMSLFPTIEIHIAILRTLMLEAGLSVIEIPPVPKGHRFICCLTHDVDFLGFVRHKFDHTMLGFLYRAIFKSLAENIRGRCSPRKLLANWKAALSIPALYLGKADDFWVQFDRYLEIEKNLPSTFYFIPFKNKAGDDGNKSEAKRKCKYDVSDAEEQIRYLITRGREIGVHGIDAWMDENKGRAELSRLRKITGDRKIGIRMHWLYFSKDSARYLERAGFYYDSTVGYNDAVGYRAGTAQVYQLPGGARILELPLHVQDTSLFYPERMDLSEPEALKVVEKLVHITSRVGGVLVINWHHRSIGPERFWDKFYIDLLELLKEYQACFMSAREAVGWFQERRRVAFVVDRDYGDSAKIGIKGSNNLAGKSLIFRIYSPFSYQEIALSNEYPNYVDTPICEDVMIPGNS